jgi:hypothetical protein
MNLAGHAAHMVKRTGAYRVWWGNLRERGDLKDIGINGRIMLKCIIKCNGGGMDWTDLAQDMERWQTLVTAVMNLRVPKKCREFLDKLRSC